MAAPASQPLTASTPGKLILAGEHAAVYRRPALVAAVDLRLRAHFASPALPGNPRPGSEVVLDLRALAPRRTLSWQEIRNYTRTVRERWNEYSEHPAGGFQRLWDNDPTHLVQIALGEALDSLDAETAPDLVLTVESDLPVGSGFGSSAAAAVAIVAGFRAWRERPLLRDEIATLALEVERRQHGFPSGVDTAASLHGGLIWATRPNDGPLSIETLSGGSPVLERIRVYDTGTPAEPTGAVVAAVRERVDRDPEASERRFDRMAQAAAGLRDELTRPHEDAPRVIRLLREAEACLEEWGVVPPPVQRVVRAVEAEGGAAKISGAGSLAGPGGGSLLVYHPRPESVERWSFLRSLRHHPVQLGAPGFRLQEEEA
jgi:mevalonate kinase